MAPFSITAQLPLGTYRGHRPDLTAERIPSVARLHSALLAAAGFGPRAIEYDGEWQPCDVDEVALRWLEDNPPTDVTVPAIKVSRNDAIAYRDDGTIGVAKKSKTIRKLPKQDSAVAVDGPFVWTWREPPPEPIADALRELCPDVPYLGSAESPVVLEVSAAISDPTHEYVPDAGLFTRGPGEHVDLPVRGRVDELARAHYAERTGKVGSDRAGTDERSTSPVPPRSAVRTGLYRPKNRPAADVPWSQVMLVPLDARVPEQDRVRVARAAHQALIKILDRDAPPVLTGIYPDGHKRPANHVALHILDREHPVALPGAAESALAVLIPFDVTDADVAEISRAVGTLRTLYSGRGRKLTVRGSIELRNGHLFWDEPAAGTVRLWRTSPPSIPDTRGYSGWTFTHAALLSLGFVWQGTAALSTPPGRGRIRDERFVEAVNLAGVAVLDTTPIRGTRVDNYVHRVNPHAVVRPYHALLHLGDLGGAQTIQAIGQCRHLGGGLLIPDDHTEGEILAVPGE
ncbi:MAG: type I-U CRISPR-associated protein Cas5/Cas6 [Nocardia sp.]|nr:type I-U CRISPR-associated protein Cas5/Cas6 [Nocardia sp.]